MKRVKVVLVAIMLTVGVNITSGQIMPGDPALYEMPTISNTTAIYYNKFEDGNYYAIVKYYNPNTFTNSSYKLVVTVKNDNVTKIQFNDGYLHSGYNSSGYTWTGGSLDSYGTTSVTIYGSNFSTRVFNIELL